MRLGTYNIVTSVPYGEGGVLRKWCRENIGKPYYDWETYPLNCERIGVKVWTEEHAILVTLRWS